MRPKPGRISIYRFSKDRPKMFLLMTKSGIAYGLYNAQDDQSNLAYVWLRSEWRLHVDSNTITIKGTFKSNRVGWLLTTDPNKIESLDVSIRARRYFGKRSVLMLRETEKSIWPETFEPDVAKVRNSLHYAIAADWLEENGQEAAGFRFAAEFISGSYETLDWFSE